MRPFEKDSAALYEELLGQPLPEKEVTVSELEKQYEEQNKEKPLIKIGTQKTSGGFEMIYDAGASDVINPSVAAMLKKLAARKTSVTQTAGGLSASSRAEIVNYAKKAKNADEFISYLNNKFNLEYDFTDAGARELYVRQNSAVQPSLLDDYTQSFESETLREMKREGYVSRYKADISSTFKQVDYKAAAHPVQRTTNWSASNEVSVIRQRKTEREEMIHSTGSDLNTMSPALIKSYLRHKHNADLGQSGAVNFGVNAGRHLH